MVLQGERGAGLATAEEHSTQLGRGCQQRKVVWPQALPRWAYDGRRNLPKWKLHHYHSTHDVVYGIRHVRQAGRFR